MSPTLSHVRLASRLFVVETNRLLAALLSGVKFNTAKP